MNSPDKIDEVNLLKAITSPLGFFAFSLLIVEGFLTIVLIYSDLEALHKFWGMLIGAGLFLLVVSGVWLLCWIKPRSLTFGEKGHLEADKMKKDFGTSDNPQTKDVVEEEEHVTEKDSETANN